MKKIKSFHGHLGPYVVLGYRAGKLAKRLLKKIDEVEIHTNKKPPDSCFIDGIQLSTGCTVGRGEIQVIKAPRLKKAIFSNKKNSFSLSIKNSVLPLSLNKIYKMNNSGIFLIK